MLKDNARLVTILFALLVLLLFVIGQWSGAIMTLLLLILRHEIRQITTLALEALRTLQGFQSDESGPV